MTDRPILFNSAMVRAILDGSKTQTRRVAKFKTPIGLNPNFTGLSAQRFGEAWHLLSQGAGACWEERSKPLRSPYGLEGDRLWVRETWQAVNGNDRARHIVTHPAPDRGWIEYAATPRTDEPAYKWRPSIHMPRWASRITLEITDVRVERLNSISEADAQAEGVYTDPACPAYEGYRDLWERINGAGSWDANPWVWVVEFKRIKP